MAAALSCSRVGALSGAPNDSVTCVHCRVGAKRAESGLLAGCPRRRHSFTDTPGWVGTRAQLVLLPLLPAYRHEPTIRASLLYFHTSAALRGSGSSSGRSSTPGKPGVPAQVRLGAAPGMVAQPAGPARGLQTVHDV